jgi:biopolymer transport protein ExbD
MKRLVFLLALPLVFAWSVSFALAADDAKKDDKKDTPDKPEITRIPITVFPNNVIIVKGEMVELDKLQAHLKELVPDAKKAGVEVTVAPKSEKEMDVATQVIKIAHEAGYTKVNYIAPEKKKVVITEIMIIVSRTGDVTVGDSAMKPADVRAYLEKLIEPDRRAKVRINVHATRLAPMTKVNEVIKACRDAGFKDVNFIVIAE